MDFFTSATVLAALAVVVVQQILKLNFIPITLANKYPVPTLIVLSIGASFIAEFSGGITPHTLTDWLLVVASVSVSAAIVYNATLANWKSLRAAETPIVPLAAASIQVPQTIVSTPATLVPQAQVPTPSSADIAIAQSIPTQQ